MFLITSFLTYLLLYDTRPENEMGSFYTIRSTTRGNRVHNSIHGESDVILSTMVTAPSWRYTDNVRERSNAVAYDCKLFLHTVCEQTLVYKFLHDPNFHSLPVHTKYTSNMALWLYSQLNDVSSPQVHLM